MAALRGNSPAVTLRGNRKFGYYFAGRSVSAVGSTMSRVALVFAVLAQPGGTGALGFVLAAQMVPIILFTAIGGGMADRVGRSTVLTLSNSLSGITQLAIAGVLFGHIWVFWIVPLAAIYGTAEAFTMPASRGALAELVTADQLTRANSLLKTSRNIAQIAGPTVAGIIVSTSTGGVALMVDAATFLFAALMMHRLNLSKAQRKLNATFAADLREGWQYFSTNRWLWSVTLAFAVTNIPQQSVWQILGPIIAQHSFGASNWGIVLSIRAVGLFAASAYLVKYAQTRRLGPALAGMSLAALPLVTLGVSPTVPALGVAAFVAGLVSAYSGIVWNTVLQSKVPVELISRVSSYDDLGAYAGIPVARMAAVGLAAIVGLPVLAVGGGILYFLAALAPLTLKSVRRM
jgi:MFS family permease